MDRHMLKVAAATLGFGLVHSALASLTAKHVAATLVGARTADVLYRPFFNAVAVALLATLVLYVRRQPVRDLYHVRGPLAWLMRAGQAAGLALLLVGVYHVGVGFLSGFGNVAAAVRGEVVTSMPDGQGPAPAGDGSMRATGPFAHTRQVLNWAILPLLWLFPRMTTRLLAFVLAATAYLVVGAILSDAHLLASYGDAYRTYQQHVPFVPLGR